MKNVVLLLCILVGGVWWCYSIIDLICLHTWAGLFGIWLGAALFLIGWGEINENEEYKTE